MLNIPGIWINNYSKRSKLSKLEKQKNRKTSNFNDIKFRIIISDKKFWKKICVNMFMVKYWILVRQSDDKNKKP